MATPSYLASASGDNLSTGYTIPLTRPGGSDLRVGDLLFVFAFDPNVVGNVTAPAGWTRITPSNKNGLAWYKVVTAADLTATHYSFSVLNGSSFAMAVILAYQSPQVMTPIVDAWDQNATATTDPIVTTVADETVIMVAQDWNSGGAATIPTPAGTTSRIAATNGTGATGYLHVRAVDMVQAAAGAVPTKTFTGGDRTITVALRAAPDPAPNAPAVTAPSDGAILPTTSPVTFSWTFSDPNVRDTQSAYEIQYRIGAAAWTTVSGTTATTRDISLPAGSYEAQIRTADSDGTYGPWSTSRFFTVVAPPAAPTVTEPDPAEVIATTTFLATWTHSTQDSYQVQVLDPSSVVVYDSGHVLEADTREHSIPFPVNGVSRTVRIRVMDQGLWSAWTSVAVTVDWEEPATPTLVATPNNSTGSITVAINNPVPAGAQPAVSSNDLYRRVVGDTGDGERIATAIAEDGSFVDYRVASGWEYEYRARAIATTGTTADSAWTD